MAEISVSTSSGPAVHKRRTCGAWWMRLVGPNVDWSWLWSLECGWHKQWDNECG